MTEEAVVLNDYLVTQTKSLVVSAASAAAAGKTAAIVFQLTPDSKLITTTVKTEKVRH